MKRVDMIVKAPFFYTILSEKGGGDEYVDQMQSESSGKTDGRLRGAGHRHRDGPQLERHIPGAMPDRREGGRSAEQQPGLAHDAERTRSAAVSAAGELSGLHHGAGLL